MLREMQCQQAFVNNMDAQGGAQEMIGALHFERGLMWVETEKISVGTQALPRASFLQYEWLHVSMRIESFSKRKVETIFQRLWFTLFL